MNRLILTLLCFWPVGVVAAPAAQSTSDRDSERSARLETMKKIVASLEVSQTIVTSNAPDEIVTTSAELVLTYTDPAREFSDSTVWLWTHKGQPVATTTLEYYPDRPADKTWIFEFTTLSTHPVTMRQGNQKAWSIQPSAAIRREFSSIAAPVPADSRSRRLQQMRDIARRFAVETYTSRGDRFVVRLMPTPLFRYPESESDRADGAVFAFAYGTNPEVILLVESAETADGFQWRYGLAPLTGIGIVVRLDDREVWTRKFGSIAQNVYVNGALAPTDMTEK